MLTFRRAQPDDAPALAAAQQQAFDQEFAFAGVTNSVAPEGYDSVEWQQQMMHETHYFTVLYGGQIVGGIIVVDKGEGVYRLKRIFITPAAQNEGIGSACIRFLENHFPHAVKWTLDTPDWAYRSQRFYEKVGYTKLGETLLDDVGLRLFDYHKKM